MESIAVSMQLDSEELLALAKKDIGAGQLEAGLGKLKQAVILGDLIEAHSLIARLYAELGLFAKAKHHYGVFLQENPTAELEAFQLGMAELDSGDEQAAIAQWGRLIDISPIYPPALYYRALLLHKNQKVEEARRDIEVIAKAVPHDNLYYKQAHELLAAMDDDLQENKRSNVKNILGQQYPADV